jgi:hypothetical protein
VSISSPLCPRQPTSRVYEYTPEYYYDSAVPQVAKAFKSAIAGVDTVLFRTSEDNRSFPGGLTKKTGRNPKMLSANRWKS